MHNCYHCPKSQRHILDLETHTHNPRPYWSSYGFVSASQMDQDLILLVDAFFVLTPVRRIHLTQQFNHLVFYGGRGLIKYLNEFFCF